jgi:hypothetical protein
MESHCLLSPDQRQQFQLPTQGLKETLIDLETLTSGTTGKKCPRCGGNAFNKAGFSKLLGKRSQRLRCRDCGYTFGISELKEKISRNRAARTFNLYNKRADDRIDSALQYGLIKKCDDGKYKATAISQRSAYYHNVPLFHHLITSLGQSPKRADYEKSLKTFSDEDLSKASKIKRDVLWRRYQEIAIEVFICEKCNFCRTCKKDHIERSVCSTVKKTKQRTWQVDIQL